MKNKFVLVTYPCSDNNIPNKVVVNDFDTDPMLKMLFESTCLSDEKSAVPKPLVHTSLSVKEMKRNHFLAAEKSIFYVANSAL